MQDFKLGSRLAIFLVAAVLTIGASSAFGCAICRSSPDGQFGFCRWGYDRGWNECTGVLKNQFTGTTTCDLEDPSCGGDCYWTGVNGDCVMEY
jgi:hypothetical protein